MSRAPDIPRLVNFSDSDMSTDSDSDIDSNTATRGNSQNSLIVDSDRSDLSEIVGDPVKSSSKTDYFSKEGAREIHKEECQSRFSGNLIQSKYGGKTSEVKYGEGSSRDKRSGSRGRRSRSWGRRSGSGGRRSESRGRRSESRGRRSESRGRRSCSRGKRSGSRGRKSSSRDRSRSRGRRSSSGYRRSRSRGRRSSSRGRGGRSRSRSRDRRRRSRSGSRGRYRRSRSGSRGKHRRSRSGSRRRRDRRHSSPRRALRRSPPRAHRTLDTLEKLGIELKPAAPPEEQSTQPAIPSYYNRMAVNPTKYAQQMAKRKLIWGSKTNEEGTAKASTWQGATFSQDQDGKMTAKFKRLMGIKGEEVATTSVGEGKGQELIKRQQELFSSMELQYEAARQATHTQRGVGLGFSSHPHHFPS